MVRFLFYGYDEGIDGAISPTVITLLLVRLYCREDVGAHCIEEQGTFPCSIQQLGRFGCNDVYDKRDHLPRSS